MTDQLSGKHANSVDEENLLSICPKCILVSFVKINTHTSIHVMFLSQLVIKSNVNQYLTNLQVLKSLDLSECLSLFLVPDLPAAGKSIAATGGKQAVPAAAGVSDADADLEARLDNLRRQ